MGQPSISLKVSFIDVVSRSDLICIKPLEDVVAETFADTARFSASQQRVQQAQSVTTAAKANNPITPSEPPTPSTISIDVVIDDLSKALINLRHQHSSLLTLMPLSDLSQGAMSSTDDNVTHASTARPRRPGSYYRASSQDTATSYSSEPLHDTESPGTYTPAVVSLPRPTHRQGSASLSSLYHEVASIYYDAEIEPWEEEDAPFNEDGREVTDMADRPTGHGPGHVRSDSITSLDADRKLEQALQEHEDQVVRAAAEANATTSTTPSHLALDQSRPRDSMDTVVPTANNSTALVSPTATVKHHHVGPVEYRKSLPSAPAPEPSLIGMLKKNIGKDLTTISFDVTFNEPLSLLQ